MTHNFVLNKKKINYSLFFFFKENYSLFLNSNLEKTLKICISRGYYVVKSEKKEISNTKYGDIITTFTFSALPTSL